MTVMEHLAAARREMEERHKTENDQLQTIERQAAQIFGGGVFA